LLCQILVKSEAEVNQWRCALAVTVGPTGEIIVNFVCSAIVGAGRADFQSAGAQLEV